MKLRKKERFYLDLRELAIEGYKYCGHWNWSNDRCWGEGETRNLVRDVELLVKDKLKTLKIDKDLNIISDKEYKQEVEINKQILKFVNARKKVLNI